MIYTFISWTVIGISAFLWGFSILSILGRINSYKDRALDLIIMTGLCALTVYAQFFSLFYKIGMMALMGVCFLDAVFLLFVYKELICWFKEKKKVIFSWRMFVAAGVGLAVLVIVSGIVPSGDTDLYHAQTIRWIEEYKVVPGLGNLHGRLAFNSSFHCLQALFSFRPILGPSLHDMNGFIVWVVLSYAFCSIKFRGNRKIYASDFVRIGLFIYYEGRMYYTASPAPDVYTMILIGYIICKWIDLLEDGEKRTAPYSYLCILSVYAVSVKLSAAMVVFLVIMPAYRLIKDKKWKEIILYTGLGILAIAPFLIRNVIISGYLVYPYPEIDLFSFDWKIPKSDVAEMRTIITAWAQGFRDKYEIVSLNEWFPVWRDNCLYADSTMYLEFIMNIIAIPASIIIGIVKGIKERDWNFFHIAACLSAGVLFWFCNAPDRRFGEIYLILLPLYLAGNILGKIGLENKAAIAAVIIMLVILGHKAYVVMEKTFAHVKREYLIVGADYTHFNCHPITWEGQIVYCPEPDAYVAGYHSFPGAPYPYEDVLSSIELRGDSFKDGFRVKGSE